MQIVNQTDKYTVSLVEDYEVETLFSSKKFISYQALVQQKETRSFTLLDNTTQRILATKSFARSSGTSQWVSPVTGAFGVMEASEFITLHEIEFFISSISSYLLALDNSDKITWRLPPQYYKNKTHTKLQNVLFRQSWCVEEFDLNFHLAVTDYDDFRSNLSSSKKRELNRITRTSPEFAEVFSPDERKDVYDVIKLNRESQGYPMTMSWDAINALADAIDQDIKFYSLKREDVVLAGAICLRLDSDTLYVFYWGEHPEYRKDSTIVKLAEGIYLTAEKLGYSTIDIGTSTDHSAPNQGLINFKENIGCHVSQKITISLSKSGK